MELFPAIDLRGGRCVRLAEGDFARETVYGDDPVALARAFAAAGAPWVHVVDLDAARSGEPANRRVIAAIASAIPVPVQAGGGVRTLGDAEELLEQAGVARVVVGTAAVERPELVAEMAVRWPGRVAVGLDHRAGEVRTRGWLEGAGRSVPELARDLAAAGAVALIVTDISRDGILTGPDVEGLADLLGSTEVPVIASGGVSSLADLAALSAIDRGGRRLAGVVVGRAIYEGRFDVAEALSVCGGATG